MAHFLFPSLLKLLKSNYLLLLVILVGLSYWRLPFTFWQQDEWHHFGQEFIWHEKGLIKYIVQDAISPFGIRFLPFASLAQYFQFSLFGQNIVGYALVSLIFHIVNTLLVYKVINKLFGDKVLSFITAALFGIAASHYQAITWLLQHTTTVLALTFSLLAIYFYKRATICLVFLILAIGFKETSYFLFPFLISLHLIQDGFGPGVKKSLPIIAAGGIYFLLILTFVFTQPRQRSEIFIPRVGVFQTFSRRLVSIPLRTFGQSIVPSESYSIMARKIFNIPLLANIAPESGSPAFAIFLEKSVVKKLIYLSSILFLTALFKFKNKVGKIAGFWLLSSAFPLLFVTNLAGDFTFLESRYLYIPAVGGTLVLAYLLTLISRKNMVIGLALFVLVLFVNFGFVTSKLKVQVETGKVRRAILAYIKSSYPKLPEKIIFYTSSDSSYYGLPESKKIMPFQSGFGQTLLVWYQMEEYFPLDFYRNDFLWDIESQGYKEIEGRGFGYYYDLNIMKGDLEKYKIAKESVVAFSWEGKSYSLTDITNQVRSQLYEK